MRGIKNKKRMILGALAVLFAALAIGAGVYASQHPSKAGPQTTTEQATGLDQSGGPVQQPGVPSGENPAPIQQPHIPSGEVPTPIP